MPTATERLASIEAKQDQHGEILGRIDAKLNGNGQPGVMVRVDRLEQAHCVGHRRWVTWADRAWKLGMMVTTAFLAYHLNL